MKNHRKLRRYSLYLLPLLFLTAILLYPSQARNGAASGLLLWFNVLLPTLLPFMILADLIRRLHIVDSVCAKLSARTGQNLYFLYPLILGLLSGLPLGAKLVADAVKEGKLSIRSGQFLLTVCNNCSMMFLIGYVAEQQLQQPGLAKLFLWLIPLSSLLSALICCMLFSSPVRRLQTANLVQATTFSPNTVSTNPPARSSTYKLVRATDASHPSVPNQPFITSISNSIMDSFTVLTQVGGFVILFSVLAEFILLTESPLTLPLVASLEMTTGVRSVCASTLSQHTKTILSAAAVSFTGLSGIAQTACVLSETGLSVIQYTISRILSAVLCAALFMLLL